MLVYYRTWWARQRYVSGQEGKNSSKEPFKQQQQQQQQQQENIIIIINNNDNNNNIDSTSYYQQTTTKQLNNIDDISSINNNNNNNTSTITTLVPGIIIMTTLNISGASHLILRGSKGGWSRMIRSANRTRPTSVPSGRVSLFSRNRRGSRRNSHSTGPGNDPRTHMISIGEVAPRLGSWTYGTRPSIGVRRTPFT